MRQVGPDSFCLLLSSIYHINPTFQALLPKPVQYSPVHPPTDVAVSLPRTLQDGSQVYKDRALLDSRHRAGTLQ